MADEDDQLLGVCAEVTGLFADPHPATYQLLGCTPEGPLRTALHALATGATAARLGDLWVQPQPGDDCPPGSERLDPWRLRGARVTGHRPHHHDPALVDVFFEAVEDDYFTPDDPYLASGVRLHNGRTRLGSCRDFSEIAPAVEPGPAPLTLLGCAPAPALTAALAAQSPRRRRLGSAYLNILDRQGRERSSCWGVPVEAGSSRPSALGAGLLDIVLTQGLWEPPPLAARPLWRRWHRGPPAAPNLWAAYDTERREIWLERVAAYHRRPPQDAPAGRVYHLDGRFITDEPGFCLAIGEAVNGPGGYFGRCLAALDDCLCGHFGATVPFTVIWHHSQVARRHLGRVLDSTGEPYDFCAEVTDLLSQYGSQVLLR
ncbi:barstar family protein [Streptomyces sp. NPDC048483]|uniref:barstar family protein n=1 Tax=Streptomyces sp. NPDC048483 TaxID=3154927 RepID=UPI00344395F4